MGWVGCKLRVMNGLCVGGWGWEREGGDWMYGFSGGGERIGVI